MAKMNDVAFGRRRGWTLPNGWRFGVALMGALLISREARAQTKLVVTAQENGVESQAQMDCRGILHGYVILPARFEGSHRLEGIWTGPDDKVMAHSRDTVSFPPPGRSTAHVWFAFPESGGAILGGIDPRGDQERLSYNGAWRLQIRWDDKPLIASSFTVRCF